MDVTFLYAPQKLVKTITQTADGKIHKSQYPLAKHFTSHTVEINTLVDLHKSISSHAVDLRKPCVLKGRIAREITDESRRNSTSTADRTQWVVLDPDEAPFTSAEEMMRALKLQDVSYIVQYSSSYKLTQSKKLSAHIFIMLDAPVPAPTLKSWLMQLNLETPALRNALSLSNSKAALKWPLDITSCQNDRLIYIAEPEFRGMKSPIKTNERIQYVKKQRERLDISRITERPIDALKKEARVELNRLQEAAGITPNKKAARMNGEHIVQYGAIEASDWEVVDDDGEFVRLNLNGGDSAAYWHYRNDFELLHNFKGEDSLKMKEVLPNYYKELVSRQKEENARIRAERSTPAKSEEGDVILCFREKQTGAYWNGTYNAGLNKLDLFPAKNERQCEHFLASHGQPPLDYIPVWQRIFNPTTDKIVNFDELTINMWSPSELMKNATKINEPEKKGFPIIQRILDSAVGTGPIQEHFLNWLAVIAQHRTKPRTAWILHGTQGCLAPETLIRFRRGKRNGGRELTIKEAYEKWTGAYKMGTGLGKTWDLNIKTYAPSVKDNLTIGYHEVFKIVESGVKTLYRVTTDDGDQIRITHEHPFMRPDGNFTPLSKLKIGDEVLKKGVPLQHIEQPKGRSKQRKIIHSIEHHPLAWKHNINGKNYKRSHKARLVVEADMNNLPFEKFIDILRNDPTKAKTLNYLANDVIVHHLDEDCSNDDLSNLEVIDKLNHDQHHAKHTGLGTITTKVAKIISIEKDGDEMTYDMVMKAPYHNYIANNFCVSNTGKGLLIHKVIAKILGPKYVVTRMQNELRSDFTGFVEFALVVFIDEISVNSLDAGGELEEKLKYQITEPVVPIRKMRTDTYEVPSYTGWIFGSNKNQPVTIPRNDRRYNVGVFQRVPLKITEGEVENGITRELQAFADYIMSRKADKTVAAVPLQTEDRDQIMELSETSIDQTANAINYGRLEDMWDAMPDEKMWGVISHSPSTPVETHTFVSVMRRSVKDCYENKVTRISRDELGHIFEYCVGGVPKSPNKLTRYLSHHGVKTTRMRSDAGELFYGIEVKWEASNEFLKTVYKPNKPQPRPRGERALRVVEGNKRKSS